MRRAIYPGSFDPITNGHMDIVRRASNVFDELIVAVSNNTSKKQLFTIEERMGFARELTSCMPTVKVECFNTLLMEYVVNHEINVIVRGLRAVIDFEMEFQMALVNKRINSSVETVFMMTSAEYSFLSSSIIKEVASFGGDVSKMVSPIVHDALKAKYHELSGK